MAKIASFDTPQGDSVNLKLIGESPFHIVGVEDSPYKDKDGKVVPGVKITTKEEFDVDGQKWNKFHTTRTVIVQKLTGDGIRAAIEAGELDAVRCVQQTPAKGGFKYYDLQDVE